MSTIRVICIERFNCFDGKKYTGIIGSNSAIYLDLPAEELFAISLSSNDGFVVVFNGQNYTASVNGQTFQTQLLSQMESILAELNILEDDNWLVD